jgi:capsular exopolysaccharide synthesis family protein
METKKKGSLPEEDNLFNQIIFRFFPYWPLFLVLIVISVAGGFLYLRYATPAYDITATILIKDEKKGLDDSKIMESLNIFSPNNIVENEMEVLQSRGLMNDVVQKLYLYAPVFSEGRVRSIPAYTSSPIIVQASNPDLLDTIRINTKIYFNYNAAQELVTLENKSYPLNQWVNTSHGTLKFIKNPNLKTAETKPLYFILVSPKEIITSVLKNLQVSAPNKLSTIVDLTLKDEDPERGEDILNELIRVYDVAAINDKNAFSSKTLSIVEGRLTQVQHQVDSIQSLINQYKSRNGIVDLSEQSSMFLKTVGDNDQKVADINMQLAVLDEVEKYANSKDHNAGVIPSTLGIDNPVLSNLLQKLYDLEINYQRLKMTATVNNPTLVSLSNDIEKTRSDILENARVQRISLNASRDNINSTINNYSSQLRNIPEKERELVEISRQLSVLSSTYDFLLQKKEEASLSYESTVGNSRTVDKAQASIKPTSPQKLIVFLLAVAFAVIMGALIVIWKELFSSKILFRSDIDKFTSIPVIAEMVDFSKKKRKEKSISNDQKKIIVHEQFRQLAASMGLYGRNVSKNKILVTSSISGEGKSFICENLALSLARSGKKVILIDLDFRNPQTSQKFNTENEVGISDFLEGEREPYEIIKHTDQNNLFIAAAGSVAIEKTNELLLNEEKLKELFNYLEEVFDFIILDTPPVEPISDAFILGEYCDFVLYIIKHRHTPKTIIKLLDQNHKIKGLKNIGIVFNAVKPRGFVKRTYGYGYGFSYEYGYHQKRKVKLQ